ncbi:hypothetical protein A7D17_02995 [Xanthomonas floridensis]|uniref:Uncharacterized protein n=1 Tax=Xanthomonas floridensis TaxID=1843580 RepID=A0A1A9MD67_9XANT|nr:hypothetical protein A7D17_02995 [Xanthomonas floridensis]
MPKFAFVLVSLVLFTCNEVNQRLHLVAVFPVKKAKPNQEIHQLLPIAPKSWVLSTTPTTGGVKEFSEILIDETLIEEFISRNLYGLFGRVNLPKAVGRILVLRL